MLHEVISCSPLPNPPAPFPFTPLTIPPPPYNSLQGRGQRLPARCSSPPVSPTPLLASLPLNSPSPLSTHPIPPCAGPWTEAASEVLQVLVASDPELQDEVVANVSTRGEGE